MDEVKLGRYLHFKGKEYVVIGLAKHSETQEKMVVYHTRDNPGEMWVRPASLFIGRVSDGTGNKVLRFKFLGPK